MTEVSKQEKLSVIPTKFIIIFSALIILFIVAVAYVIIMQKNEITITKKKNDNLIIKLGISDRLLDENFTECNAQKVELDKMKKRMEGIKDQKDLLRRDIQIYISEKFKKIPKIVAYSIADNIIKYSSEEKLSPELVVGLVEVESGFDPTAVSKAKARGLMQIMPEWAKKFEIKDYMDFHDIDINIKYGIKVLKIHIAEQNGNVTKGLFYYVGRDSTYAGNVYKAVGKFVSFRHTVDDETTTYEDDIKQEIEKGEVTSELNNTTNKPNPSTFQSRH